MVVVPALGDRHRGRHLAREYPVKKVWRFLKQSWWWILLIVGGVFLAIWKIGDRGGKDAPEPQGPTFTERARGEIERVRLEGELEKARVTARADAQRAELDTIEEVGRDNPAEGRRQLANWLSSNL